MGGGGVILFYCCLVVFYLFWWGEVNFCGVGGGRRLADTIATADLLDYLTCFQPAATNN